MRYLAAFTGLFAVFSVPQPDSATVTIKGTHLCCGGCQSGAEDALTDLKGITDISCDLNTKVISFKSDSEKSAKEAVSALADAGFYGTASRSGKSMTFPDSGAKKSSKSNTLKLTGVHLCCTSCVTASQKALEKVKGVTLIDIDRNEKTIKLTGDSIVATDAVAALNKAGFFCRVPKK